MTPPHTLLSHSKCDTGIISIYNTRFKWPAASINQTWVYWYLSLHIKRPHDLKSELKCAPLHRDCHLSLLSSSLESDFDHSGCLWLTGEWAIGLHQKVQPDSLIWQPSSDQTYSSFWALHQLDKKERSKQKSKKEIRLLKRGFPLETQWKDGLPFLRRSVI